MIKVVANVIMAVALIGVCAPIIAGIFWAISGIELIASDKGVACSIMGVLLAYITAPFVWGYNA